MLSLVLLVDIAGLLSPKLFEKLLQRKKEETIQLDERNWSDANNAPIDELHEHFTV